MRHMLDAAREAVAISGRRGPKSLAKNRVLSLALVRLLEVLGEAAGRVSERTRGEHPEVPWAQIVGLRNRLIHGYDSVDLEVLWRVLKEDLPPLIRALEGATRTPHRPGA